MDFQIKPVNPARYHNPWHPDDPSVFNQTFRKWRLDFPWNEVSAEVLVQLERGRLSMTCPFCGQQDPAGPWCRKCGRMVRHEHWSHVEVGQPQEPGKRRRGRPSKKDVEEATRMCTCGGEHEKV